VRLIVPFSPGGGSDVVARLIAPYLTQQMGQQVVVDNRPGGNTVIGAGLVASAAPDGHTLLLANANFTINAALFKKLPYDPLVDFVPVSPVASVANVLVVNASLPVDSVQALIGYAKAHPGKLNFASPGNGTSSHLAGVLLQAVSHIDFVTIPYKGAGPAMTELIGGQAHFAIAAMASVLPHVKSGRLRALAVTTAKRSTLMPSLPTVAESGYPGYEVNNWFGIMSSRGTPQAVVRRLHDYVDHAVKDGAVQERMASQGTEPFAASSEQFSRFVRNEIAQWTRLAKDYHLQAE
jgi:tripartite-type tricarboxylate transporter receptor subunit TctC